jgi:hypothetical protein
VRLLALAFAYSLWVLALFEVVGHRPYVSAALAVLLSTAAVVSLIGYRESALLGYLPVGIASSLKDEIIAELDRAGRSSSGRSVQNRTRIILAADLQIFADLLDRLLDEGDPLDLAACLASLGEAFSYYTIIKPTLEPTSMVFARSKQRLRGGGEGIEESILAKGLMTPTSEVPDHLWFERRVLELTRKVSGDPHALRHAEVTERLFTTCGVALQYAWYLEDPDSVALILGEVESFTTDARVREQPELAEALTNTLWALVEALGNGFSTTAEQIVAREPWKDSGSTGLPWLAREDARQLVRRIRGEMLIAGEIVTPPRVMIAELEGIRGPRLQEQRHKLLARVLGICRLQLEAVEGPDMPGAPMLARMTIRIVLRIVHHGMDLPDVDDVRTLLLRASVSANDQEGKDLRSEAGLAARVLAGEQLWEACEEMLAFAARSAVIARALEHDTRRQMLLTFDMLFTLAAVYGWGEFHQRPGRVHVGAHYLAAPYVDLDALAALIDNHSLFQLRLPIITYARWFGPLKAAVNEVPERPVFDGGIGFGVERDHPSPLIAQSSVMFGPPECLEHLVHAAIKQRAMQRTRLLGALVALLKQRERS